MPSFRNRGCEIAFAQSLIMQAGNSSIHVAFFLFIDVSCFSTKTFERMKKQMFYLFSVAVIVTENLSNEGFRFLKLSEFKQLKSFVRIGRNFKANYVIKQQ